MRPMIEGGPTTGPMSAPRPAGPYNFSRFDELMTRLQGWRSDDHEDAITLHRNQIIEIIEGVKSLRDCKLNDR